MDDFEWSAWRAFQEAPDSVFSRQEMRAGKRVLRVAVADRMTTAACVECHNKHPQSAKRDWKIGDVRGVMDVTKVIERPLTAADARSGLIIASVEWVAGVAAVSVVLIAALVSRRTREKDTAHEHIRFLAHHDALTGLLNRISFKQEVELVLRKRLAVRGSLAVYYVDLDELKEINDKLGHEVGDALIQGVAERLRKCFANAAAIARVGGDEFAIAQLGVESPEAAEREAAAVLQALAKPYVVNALSVTISASVGIYLASQRMTSASEVLNAADLALYRAKAAGRQCTVVYNEVIAAEVAARRKIESALRSAVQKDAFELYFQPICSARTYALEGFEALLRLRDETGSFIAPSAFIPVAEQLGLIDEIGEWALHRACVVASSWPSHLSVAVNLSPSQFRFVTGKGRISQIASRALACSGLDPNRLEVEITESLLLERTDEVMAELRELKDLGVKLVMDDFGTGYSSLSYLWKLPLDKLKIDKSFVAAPPTERCKVAPILQAITTLARVLNLRITAEGVETQEQLLYLKAFSCHQMQGYFFGRPLSSDELSNAISHEYATCNQDAASVATDRSLGRAHS
jgi:diguanylate cyclase (GGDEF)-like protein